MEFRGHFSGVYSFSCFFFHNFGGSLMHGGCTPLLFSARASSVRFYTTHAEAGEPAFNVMMMMSRRQQLVLGSAGDGHLVGTRENLWMGSVFGMYGGYHGDGVCGFEEFSRRWLWEN